MGGDGNQEPGVRDFTTRGGGARGDVGGWEGIASSRSHCLHFPSVPRLGVGQMGLLPRHRVKTDR